MKYRPAVLLLTVALLSTLGWTGESWAQAKIPRVGILTFDAVTVDTTVGTWLEPFRRTLADEGWIEGKNVAIEYRSARSDPSRFAEAAAELVRLKVDVIFAHSASAVRVAYAATRTIPIVGNDFVTDPVAQGYAESYSRPGGNVTGVFLDAPELAGKWFELLRAIVPGLSRAVVLWDPIGGPTQLRAVQSIARSIGIQLQIVEVHKPDDIDRAFSAFRGRPQALIILPSPMIYAQSEQLAKLAIKHRLPATSMAREFADAGGAVAYGPERAAAYRRGAVLVAKILGGARPADLPVERPTKIQLIVNLKTTEALRLTVPDSVLVRADAVIR